MHPLHFILLLSVLFIWGMNFVAMKASLAHFPPFFLSAARSFLCCLPLLFYFKKPIPPLKRVFFYSMVMFVIQFTLLFLSIHVGLSAALASLLLQTQSFFALFFAIFFLKESYHPRQTMGFLTALVGILLVATHLGQDAPPLGLALVLLSAGMWAMGSVLVREIRSVSGAHLVMWGSLFAWPPLLALSFFMEGPSRILACFHTWAPLPIAALFYTAYGATIAGFGIWNHLLQRYPLSKVSPFTLLVPIVGMLSASLLLNEPLPWWKIGAGILILGGLCIHQGVSWKKVSSPEN